MHRENGSLICKHTFPVSGRMPLAARADTCQQEETLCHQCPCHLFFSSVRVLTSGGPPGEGGNSIPSLSLGNQGTLGKFHNFTDSQPLYKMGTSDFLGVGLYFICLCTYLCKGRRTWRTESVLRVFLNPVPFYYFWDRVSHCSWKSPTDLLVSELQTAFFLCPPKCSGVTSKHHQASLSHRSWGSKLRSSSASRTEPSSQPPNYTLL